MPKIVTNSTYLFGFSRDILGLPRLKEMKYSKQYGVMMRLRSLAKGMRPHFYTGQRPPGNSRYLRKVMSLWVMGHEVRCYEFAIRGQCYYHNY